MSNEKEPVKITSLQLENVKRVSAVSFEPTANGLTVIGGKNRQGKTSVLDAICWAIGGTKFAPSNPKAEGKLNNPTISITLSNGLVVERKGKNSALTVTDPTGKKHGQALLDSFTTEFALDLPKFIEGNSKKKAEVLLGILGIGDELAKIDADISAKYSMRTAKGQIADSKKRHSEELPEFKDAPNAPVSISDLLKTRNDIAARNDALKEKHQKISLLQHDFERVESTISDLKKRLSDAESEMKCVSSALGEAYEAIKDAVFEDTSQIESMIQNAETINAQVSANSVKRSACDEARKLANEYEAMTNEIEALRAKRLSLLESAQLPLPGLAVVEGELIFNGQQWDCMSGAEQLQVATAIVRKLNPECGFVLVDKLEQMDIDTLNEFGAWCEQEGLQVIATRVSTGEECTIVIEDGISTNNEPF